MNALRIFLAAVGLTLAASVPSTLSPFDGGFEAAAQLRGGLGSMRQKDEAAAPIRWTGSARMTGKSEGVITLTATMAEGWHIYGMEVPADGPQPTRFAFTTGKEWKLQGKMTVSPAPVKKMDPTFGAEMTYWERTAVFTQKFKLSDTSLSQIRCSVTFMGCNDQTCLPPATENFNLTITREGK